MRILGIDYGEARVGLAITDPLGITAQGLETVEFKGNDKVLLKRLDEIFEQYEVDTIVVGMPYNMNGSSSFRVEATEKFIHKLKCKYYCRYVDDFVIMDESPERLNYCYEEIAAFVKEKLLITICQSSLRLY